MLCFTSFIWTTALNKDLVRLTAPQYHLWYICKCRFQDVASGDWNSKVCRGPWNLQFWVWHQTHEISSELKLEPNVFINKAIRQHKGAGFLWGFNEKCHGELQYAPPPPKKIQFGRFLEYNYKVTIITLSVGVDVMNSKLPLHSNFVSWPTISPPSPKQLEVNPIIAQNLFSLWCVLTKDIFWSRIHSVALLYLHRKRLWPFQTIRLCILTGGTEPVLQPRGTDDCTLFSWGMLFFMLFNHSQQGWRWTSLRISERQGSCADRPMAILGKKQHAQPAGSPTDAFTSRNAVPFCLLPSSACNSRPKH